MLYTQLTLRPRKKNSPQSQVDISLASLEDIQKKKKSLQRYYLQCRVRNVDQKPDRDMDAGIYIYSIKRKKKKKF